MTRRLENWKPQWSRDPTDRNDCAETGSAIASGITIQNLCQGPVKLASTFSMVRQVAQVLLSVLAPHPHHYAGQRGHSGT